MEVFVLFGCMDYEGDEMLGVYASLAEAESARDQYMTKHNGLGYNEYDIQRRVVGAPAQAGWESKYV